MVQDIDHINCAMVRTASLLHPQLEITMLNEKQVAERNEKLLTPEQLQSRGSYFRGKPEDIGRTFLMRPPRDGKSVIVQMQQVQTFVDAVIDRAHEEIEEMEIKGFHCCRVKTDFSALIDLADGRANQDEFGVLRKEKAFSELAASFVPTRDRFVMLTKPIGSSDLPRFPVLRYEHLRSGATDPYVATGPACFLIFAESRKDFDEMHVSNILPIQWVTEVVAHRSERRSSLTSGGCDGKQIASSADGLYTNVTFKTVENGVKYKFRVPDTAHAGGDLRMNLLELTSKLQAHKPEHLRTKNETQLGVWRHENGRFTMHILEITENKIDLYTKGRKELGLRCEYLTRVVFGNPAQPGSSSWQLSFNYSFATDLPFRSRGIMMRSGHKKKDGELTLFMQTPQDFGVVNSLVCNAHEHVVRDISSGIYTPDRAEQGPDRELLKAPYKTGKLEVHSSSLTGWDKKMIEITSTGQLIMKSATGTRPLYVINLIRSPVHKIANILIVPTQVGTLRLRCRGSTEVSAALVQMNERSAEEEADEWMGKIQAATLVSRIDAVASARASMQPPGFGDADMGSNMVSPDAAAAHMRAAPAAMMRARYDSA